MGICRWRLVKTSGEYDLRLRKLEIQGFKSFPDKTELVFERPITAVVGPNGSGKSNIADAVRWVLGEQSTKTLRGGKMEDVIFSGARDRGAVGYAHVQLVIDNTGGRLAEHGDEVTISRRLYRSGESEYRLNGASVRLRDIHELLMDTGLGRDGYAIIGQGRIAEIVSAKSGSRREIFEEAAGISKFRYRKEESERRLAATEDNLVRLRDILLELESRVGPLKEQSDKAKEFIALSEEKKGTEISIWMHSLSAFKLRLSAQDDKIYIRKNAYQTLENESDENEREAGALYSRIQSVDTQMEECRGAVKTLEEDMAAALSQVAVLENDIRHNTQTIAGLESEAQSLSLGAGELAGKLSAKEDELSAAQKECQNLAGKVDAAVQRLEEQRENIQKVTVEIDGLSESGQATRAAIQQMLLEKTSRQTMLEESRARLDDLRGRSGAGSAVLGELIESREECNTLLAEEKEKLSGLKNSLSGYEIKRENRQKSLEELNIRSGGYLDKAREAARRAGLLEELEKNMEGFAGGVKYILTQAGRGAISGIIGPVGALIGVEDTHTLAIETALGPAIQNVVVEDDVTAKRAIRMLKESGSGRATFLPLNTVRGSIAKNLEAVRRQEGFVGLASELVQVKETYRGVINQLLGRVCVSDDLESAGRIAKAAGYGLRVVSLDGQVVNAGGSFTGGSSSKGTGILGRRREIEDLNVQAAQARQKAADIEPRCREMASEISAIDAALIGIKAEIQTTGEEIVRLGTTQAGLDSNIQAARAAGEMADKELASLTARLGELTAQGEGEEKLLEEMNTRLSKLEQMATAAKSRRDSLDVGVASAGEALAQLRLTQLTAENDRERLDGELLRLQIAREEGGERASRLASQKARLEGENRQILERIEKTKAENTGRLEEKEERTEKIIQLRETRVGIEGKITALHTAERERSGRREQVSRELAELEAGKAQVQGEYDQIIAKLWDEYELTRSEAAKLALPLTEPDKARRNLAELRSRIRGLGSVNLAAIEEYKEVGERYEEMRKQVGDVENSKEKITEMIAELTRDMRELFTESFEKIAGHFGEIFTVLFGGGRAELTLTDTEDVLEAGVEIFVQPPGKIIKNLSLLSGGEQAFVAIAIYFAILRVRPAPFCVLDEIEAALDDVNVVRFADYLRRMSDGTQFIAITHRRGTMEEADVLYGVTMQQEGISKLLALQTSQIGEQLGVSG